MVIKIPKGKPGSLGVKSARAPMLPHIDTKAPAAHLRDSSVEGKMPPGQSQVAAPAALKARLSKIHVLTHAELAQLFAVITDLRDQALFLVAYRHGMRASEIGLLERNDVDTRTSRITIHRLMRSPSNVHPLQKDERAALKRYLKSRNDSSVALFLGPRGRAVTRRGLDWLMKTYGAQAHVPPNKRHFHTLKHSIAVHLLSKGTDLRSVHDWLGHTLLQSTAIYLYLTGTTSKPL